MSSKYRVSQIIKAFVTVVTLVALTGGFRIIKAALDYMSRLTRGTLYTIGPAQLTNGLISACSKTFLYYPFPRCAMVEVDDPYRPEFMPAIRLRGDVPGE
jgi:hypothetical protein